MYISAINPSVSFSHDEVVEHAPNSSNQVLPPAPELEQKPCPKKTYNTVGLSGGLALAFLGTTAVTGIAHARMPHIISSALAIGAALFHVESLAVRNSQKTDYYA